MKISYVEKDGTKHTLTFHEDDLQEALSQAYDDGAREVKNEETGEVLEIEKPSSQQGI